jgi:hypothetical protein
MKPLGQGYSELMDIKQCISAWPWREYFIVVTLVCPYVQRAWDYTQHQEFATKFQMCSHMHLANKYMLR